MLTFSICTCSTPAKRSDVRAFVDDPTGSARVTAYTDDFISTRYHNQPSCVVGAGTADTFLTNQSFTLAPVTWTYTFTASQLADLRSYIANGHIFAMLLMISSETILLARNTMTRLQRT